MKRVMVIGAGLAGMLSALRLRQAGHDVTVISLGAGGLTLSPGSVDILGYDPALVRRPFQAFDSFLAKNLDHPYGLTGKEAVASGYEYLKSVVGPDFMQGEAEENVLLVTAAGALRPTTGGSVSLRHGDFAPALDGKTKNVTIMGLRQFKDFFPEFICGNLKRTPNLALEAEAAWLDFPARAGEVDSSGVNYGRCLDTQEGFDRLVKALKKALPWDNSAVGLPAVLGLRRAAEIHRDLEEILGREVFEIIGLPPCLPGLRLETALEKAAKAEGVRIILGAQVTGFSGEKNRITSLKAAVAGRVQEYDVDLVVHAGGGFESGSLELDSEFQIKERIFSLPCAGADIPAPTHGDYWGSPQPLFTAGLAVNKQMNVVDPETKEVIYENLWAVGSVLAGANRWDEKSGEGVVLASVMAATQAMGVKAEKTKEFGENKAKKQVK